MKFSEQWLREWVNPAITSDALIEQLTMAGLEVDGVSKVANDFQHIVIGEVLSVDQHPDADKLTVCQVNVGNETLQIVCGARNVTPGSKVPVALIGAELSPEFKIKKSKLRGVESNGMLCSAKELGLAEESQGILLLPQDAPIGTSIRDYLQLDDVAIEVDLTPNRADCLSIAGLAREVAVMNRCDFLAHPIKLVAATLSDTLAVQLAAAQACPHYVGRIIRNVDNKMATPLWLSEKLRRSGLRTIDPIVDVTNFVMLEQGQPLHAFDLDKLQGKITVRFAKADETLTLLNQQIIKLTEQDLVIADESGAIALAGVMGGLSTAVTDETKNIFLESAFFTPEFIAGRARYHGLHTDSSHRFERGVDIDLQQPAIERASELILQIAGGQAGALTQVKEEKFCPQPRTINLRYPRIKRLLGVTLDKNEVADILTRLGMQVSEPKNEVWQVQVPTRRFDISIEEDLIEELARIHGYDKITATLPNFELTSKEQSERHIALRRFKQVLVDKDYREVITYSFVDPALQALVAPNEQTCQLVNPISADLSVMRTSLMPGLLACYSHNSKRQQTRLRFFESGLRFFYEHGQLKQQPMLAGLISGSAEPENWCNNKRQFDFFDIKADVMSLLDLSRLNGEVKFTPSEHPALHPGQSAFITRNEQKIGFIGALHPLLAQKLDIKENVLLFELNLQGIDTTELPKFATLSKYPLIRRDIAMIVSEAIPAADITQVIREAAGSLLVDLHLFDVYQGQGVESGCKSLAVGLILQHAERTLQDEEVNLLMQNVVTQLEKRFKAKLRE